LTAPLSSANRCRKERASTIPARMKDERMQGYVEDRRP
jgi:hypothetical protein